MHFNFTFLKFIIIYYVDTSVLLENILVKFIKTTSGT